MTKPDLVGFVIRDFPPALLALVEERATAHETNMRVVMSNALAEHYEVKWRAASRRSAGSNGATTVEVKMPRTLRRRLHVDAARRGVTSRARAIEIIEQALRA